MYIKQKKYAYHKRFLSKAAILRVKKQLGRTLSLRDYNAQIEKIFVMPQTLHKFIGIGMLRVQANT